VSWTLYILRCRDGSLYTGITNDLPRRLAAHAKGMGARYTRGRGPFALVHGETYPDQASAAAREHVVKSLNRQQKESLIGEPLHIAQEAGRMGVLYLVGTPIGNLEDMTLRAQRILREVSVIAAEDTRQTRKLLSHFGIQASMVSYHEHNLRTVGPALLTRLLGGEDVAIVTDAGMPGISDPGQHLVALAHDAGVPVVAVPGPTAVVAALVVSGFATDRFSFDGFLPRAKKERKAVLQRLAAEERTTVLFEAPHRLLETLEEMKDALGERQVAVCRELTKKFEEVVRATPAELMERFRSQEPRGEITIVVSGVRPPAADEPAAQPGRARLAAEVAALEADGHDRKAAMKLVGARYGMSRRDVYQALLGEKE
jgi:16S rRNA (cytidine1402-2'-O)-methyltransferase